LPKEIFEVEENADLLHQVVVSQLANRRQVLADTKTRDEVSGGGKKPWRQKGTGRARVGSNRSPLWRHGGITFGPTNEIVFKKEIPARMKKTALCMALSGKTKDKEIIVLEELKLEKPKTKLMAEVLKNLSLENGTVLIVLPEMNKDLISSARNIKKARTIQAKDLNCLDVLSSKYVVLLKNSIKVIKETVKK
jgi:large subunit ribosomal protein L4